MTLRPYQAEAVNRGADFLLREPGKKALIVAPTGSGKSHVIAGLVGKLDGPVLVFQPGKEILRQNVAKLAAAGVKPSIFSASSNRRDVGPVTFATIGSVVRHAERFKDFPHVIIDECHLVNAKVDANGKAGQYKTFLEVTEKASVLGLTATPYRLATNRLGSELRFLTRTRPKVFQRVLHVTQVGALVKAGYLCRPRYKEIPTIDHSRLEVNSTGADWTDESVRRHLEEISFSERLSEGVGNLLAAGRKHIIPFTRFTREAEALARDFPDVAAVVKAKTPPRERDQILKEFKAGLLKVVPNVGILGLGFDYPALQNVVLARPTMSLQVYCQQVGRAMRPHPSKQFAEIVDMVGLVERFGKVEDMVIKPGGKSGTLWAAWSHGRQLTNVSMER